MPSITTVYRAIVMIATGVIVVKGWQLYGPSNEQVKTFATAALEKAQEAWNGSTENATLPLTQPIDPRNGAPPVVTQLPGAAMNLAPIASAPQLVPSVKSGEGTLFGAGEAAPATSLPFASALEPAGVTTLLARLQELGGADAQVGPWGSSGELYRCCCRAKLAETSALARHFEAVAGEPTAAVEQVVAKVEAWRTEQQNPLR
jgi:hypothetical protein